MSRNVSLLAAYLLDGNGNGRKIGWTEIKQQNSKQGIHWIHLNYTAQHSLKWLVKDSGVNKIIAKAMLAEESRPRCIITPTGVSMFLRGLYVLYVQE